MPRCPCQPEWGPLPLAPSPNSSRIPSPPTPEDDKAPAHSESPLAGSAAVSMGAADCCAGSCLPVPLTRIELDSTPTGRLPLAATGSLSHSGS